MHRRAILTAALLVLTTLRAAAAATGEAAALIHQATPESVGFSNERLKRLDVATERAISSGEYAGAVILAARHGKVIYFRSHGHQDLHSGSLMKPDTIFRIFSMTKAVTAAAMMILYEEGRWSQQDPISKFIPQFAGLKVYQGVDPASRMLLEEPQHPPTMHELMTMTAGFSYGLDSNPAERLYRDSQDRNIFWSGSLSALIERLAAAPLLYQPGTRWMYSVSADVQGYIIKRLSGLTFPDFLAQRLFRPLRMTDTDFFVPAEKHSRLATLYKMSDQGQLRVTEEAKAFGYDFDKPPALPTGGGGLVSTAVDFYRFAQMLSNGGELDGVRILGPQTVKLIISNHLSAALMPEFRGGGYEFNKPRRGVGYGYNGAVIVDPGEADMPLGKGSYLWDGAAGTWFWIDPTNDIVCVGMAQRWGWGIQRNTAGLPTSLEQLTMATLYQALLRPDL